MTNECIYFTIEHAEIINSSHHSRVKAKPLAIVDLSKKGIRKKDRSSKEKVKIKLLLFSYC